MQIFTRSRLNKLLNLALIVAAIAFVVMAIFKYRERTHANSPRRPPIEVGSKIDLPGLVWGENEATLLLVLSTECHFCSESMPFYRQIVEQVGNIPRRRLIAVFAQSVTEGRQYLSAQGLAITDVRQATAAELGVSGVPTLILIDKQGTVSNVWVGKLGPNLEQLVKQRFFFDATSSAHDADLLDPSSLRKALDQKESLTLLDLADRDTYQQSHIENAINIPFDELETRLQNELKTTDRLVVYEHGSNDILSQHAFEILKTNGFTNVAILQGGFPKWQAEVADSPRK